MFIYVPHVLLKWWIAQTQEKRKVHPQLSHHIVLLCVFFNSPSSTYLVFTSWPELAVLAPITASVFQPQSIVQPAAKRKRGERHTISLYLQETWTSYYDLHTVRQDCHMTVTNDKRGWEIVYSKLSCALLSYVNCYCWYEFYQKFIIILQKGIF